MSEFNFLKEREKNISAETRIFVKKSFDILERIHELMQEKNINQKQLADKLNKTEAEISKWINGVQNFTIKTLSKLEAALGEEIVNVSCKRNKLRQLEQLQVRQASENMDKIIYKHFSKCYAFLSDLREKTEEAGIGKKSGSGASIIALSTQGSAHISTGLTSIHDLEIDLILNEPPADYGKMKWFPSTSVLNVEEEWKAIRRSKTKK